MSNKFFIVLSSLLIIFLFLFAANSAVSQTLPEPAKRQPVPVDQIPVESHFPLPNQEIEGFRDRLINEYAHKANQITNYYVSAQRAFYRKDYEKAIQQIDLALEIIENADLLALKGSIYLAKGSIPEAKTFWEKALKLDKEVPLSHLPGLKKWLVEVGLLK